MPTRLIDLPFTSGLNEAVDETVAQLPTMTELMNYRLTRAGRLEHRLGVKEVPLTPMSVTGQMGVETESQSVDGNLLLAGGRGFFWANGAWSPVGTVSQYQPCSSFSALVSSGTDFTHPSCAVGAGYIGVVSRELTATPVVQIRIFDEETRELCFDTSKGVTSGFGADNRGRVLMTSTSIIVVRQNTATGFVYGERMALTKPFPLFGAPVNMVSASATTGFDVFLVDDTQFLLVYWLGGEVIIHLRSTANFALIDSLDIAEAGDCFVTCTAVGSRYFISWVNTVSGNWRCATLDTALTQVGATLTLSSALAFFSRPTICDYGDGSSAMAFVTRDTPSVSYTDYQVLSHKLLATGADGVASGVLDGYYLTSKAFCSPSPFGDARRPAAWVANHNPNTSEVDRSSFLVSFFGATFVDTVLQLSASPSKAPDVLSATDWLPEVAQGSGAEWHVAMRESFRGLATATPQTRTQLYSFAYASRSVSARSLATVSGNGQTVVLGGAPRFFDGARLCELGMAHGPTVLAAASSAGTGSLVAGSTYRYVFVVEYFDANGNRQLSYPSLPYSFTVGGGDNTVDVTVDVPLVYANPDNNNTSSLRSAVVRAYRTTANSGTVYRYSPQDSAPNGVPISYATGAAGVVTFTDVASDAEISANEAVYVQVGNARSNYRAPPCRFGCEHEGRLAVSGGWNPSEVNVSKLFFPGEGIQFADDVAFTLTNPEPVTGLASLDGSLVIFCRRSIYTVSGDGPTDDGAGSFTSPRKLPGRIGCIDWRSVVTREDGVYFRAADGLYMLPRGLASPTFVGAAIKEKLRQYPVTLGAATATRTVSAAVDDHDSEQVLAWLVADAEDPTSTAIFVLSLATSAWTEVALPENLGNLHTVIGVWRDAVESSDVLAFLRRELAAVESACFLVEDVGTTYYRDISDSFEPLLAGYWQTGKLFPFGFGGRGSIRTIRLVGDCLGATTLTPTIYSDDDAAGYVSDTLTFAPGRFAVEIPFRRRDLAWIQIRVDDPTSGSGNRGAGLRFNGLALEVEMEGGLHRTTPNERST